MSQEDVRNTTGLLAESRASSECRGPYATQGHHQDLEKQSHGKDGIVLQRIASLPVDMFEPSDFTGRFSKIQSRSRKRSRILGGRREGRTHVIKVNTTRRRSRLAC